MNKIKFAPYHDFKQYKEMMTKMPKSPEEIKKNRQDGQWHGWEADLRSRDLSLFDLSKYNPMDFDFDTLTTWPDKDKMPKGFSPDEVMENMKDPGLGIQRLHKLGLTGEGMNMAIIDQRLPDHQEYHNNIVYYREFGDFSRESKGSMHGSAVASIAVGQTCGVAPEANLYYIAEQNLVPPKTPGEKTTTTFENVVKAVNHLLDVNENLPDKEKIQVISMSWNTKNPIPFQKELDEVVKRCKKVGIFFNTTSCDEDYGLESHGLARNIFKNPNESDSYGETFWGKNLYTEKALSFPMDHRTTAAPNGFNDYVHYSQGGWSWKQPFESALFLLAKQVNPQITPEDFWKVGLKTATKKGCLNIINPIKLVNTLSKEMLKKLRAKKSLTADEKKHIKDLQKWIKGTETTLRKTLKRRSTFVKVEKGKIK